jgi:hypothetical protein
MDLFFPRVIKPKTAATLPPYLAGGIPAANCVRAYMVKGAANLAASYVDATLNQNAAPGTPPTWDATNGWKFAAASSQYLTTDLVPTATTSILCRLSDYTANDSAQSLFGAYHVAGTQFVFFPYQSSGKHQCRWGNYATAIAPVMGSGVLIVTPTGVWIDGTKYDNIAGTWGTMTRQLLIGAQMQAAPTGFISAYIQEFWAYNINVAAYVADLTAAAQAL